LLFPSRSLLAASLDLSIGFSTPPQPGKKVKNHLGLTETAGLQRSDQVRIVFP
jgi:hypothetical protein